MSFVKLTYSEEFDFAPRVQQPVIRYMLSSSPRCGSTFLALNLWSTGLCGAPMEYLNPRWVANSRILEDDAAFRAYWKDLEKRRTSNNGVFGYKAFLSDLGRAANIGQAAIDALHPDFIIRLSRKDKLLQAISQYRAVTTGRWFADSHEAQSAEYDFGRINAFLFGAFKQEQAWRELTDRMGVEPIEVHYEELEINIDGVLKRLMNALGIDERDNASPTKIKPLERQRDGLNAEWRARFMDDFVERYPNNSLIPALQRDAG